MGASGSLAALATQTQLPTELVVTDDSSTDDTIAIVDEFAKSAPFTGLKVIRNNAQLGYRRRTLCVQLIYAPRI